MYIQGELQSIPATVLHLDVIATLRCWIASWRKMSRLEWNLARRKHKVHNNKKGLLSEISEADFYMMHVHKMYSLIKAMTIGDAYTLHRAFDKCAMNMWYDRYAFIQQKKMPTYSPPRCEAFYSE